MSVILFKNDKVIHLIDKEKHLPKGMVQQVVIDLRGQAYTQQDIIDIRQKISEKSNNIIKKDDIEFIK